MVERMIETDGIELCTEAFGDPGDPPVLLIMGVGASMLWWEDGFCRILAEGGQERILSLVLISTSPAVPGDRVLPPPTEEFNRFVSTARVDWSDTESVIGYKVGYSRVLAGGLRPFDEAGVRELIRVDVSRAHDFAAQQNHYAVPDDGRRRAALSSIAVPTLVIHGTADPMFPVEHGEALAKEVPGAGLVRLKDAGHGVERPDWETVGRAVLGHSAAT